MKEKRREEEKKNGHDERRSVTIESGRRIVKSN
jgi:hypothetical protein